MSRTPLEFAEQLQNIITDARKQFDMLASRLSVCDLKQQDLLHFIENNNFNACQGYTLAKRIKEVREERREVKEQLERYNYFQFFTNDDSKNKIERVIKGIKNRENYTESKKYKARVLDELTLQEKEKVGGTSDNN